MTEIREEADIYAYISAFRLFYAFAAISLDKAVAA